MTPLKILDRVGRSSGSGFHSAFVTTFATEFAAFEELLLPQLLAVGCRNIGLIGDRRMTSLAMSDGSSLPRHLGRTYALYGPPPSEGLFHPKIILQLGRDRGRAFVSSANTTAAGLGGNVEIGTEVECTDQPSPERQLISAIAIYVASGVTEPGAVRDALDWARSRSPWLEPASAEQFTPDVAFLAGPSDQSLVRQFSDRIGEPVARLLVASPYWDDRLRTLEVLTSTLRANRTSVLIDAKQHEFPVGADLPSGCDLIDISTWRPSRFTHAKLIIAQTASHDHVLSGSANCTFAALGDLTRPGNNAEACIYRRFSSGQALKLLGLETWASSDPIRASDLPPPTNAPPIELSRLASCDPGQFSLQGSELLWRPPPNDRLKQPVIHLLDEDLTPLVILTMENPPAQARFHIEPAVARAATFAQVFHERGSSALAGIEHVSLLKRTRREPLSARGTQAVDWASAAVDLELFALEALDALAREDQRVTSLDRLAAARPGQPNTLDAEDVRVLSYDQFMSERAKGNAGHSHSENSLDGTESDHVRLLLNRLSAFDGGEADAEAEDEESEAQGSEGRTFVAAAARHIERTVDARAFELAVDRYVASCVGEHAIGPHDVLRLRLWLMILLLNARCASLTKGLAPTLDNQGWPRLVFRILVAFFASANAPITRLVVEQQDGSLPKDYLETWATVLWALDATEREIPPSSAAEGFLPYLQKLRSKVVTSLQLTTADLSGDVMRDRFAGLERQLGARIASGSSVLYYKKNDSL